MVKKLVVCGLLLASFASAYTSPGQPAGFVNDYAGMLSSSERQALEQKISDFKASTTNEIAVVTISSLDGDTIENYANELFNEWGIGKKGKDNGVLILISKDDRKMRIEVGYGLEPSLTDAQSFWIINKVMAPAFKQENYYQGVNGALDKIIAAIGGEKIPSEENSGGDISLTGMAEFLSSFFNVFSFIPIIWVVVIILGAIFGKTKSWWAGGVFGGIIALVVSFIKGFLYFGLASFFLLIPLGLLFDYLVSKTFNKYRPRFRVRWWDGFGFGTRSGGGSSGGGGGGGGFGGGSSGGGGASGSW